MKPLFLRRMGTVFLDRDGLTPEILSMEFKNFFPQEDARYIDDVSKLAGIAASRAWEGGAQNFTPESRKDFAVIVGTALGGIDSTVRFDAQALQKGPNAVNPMDFPNTVANAAGSRIGIWLQLKGPNVTLTNGGTSLLDAIGFSFQAYNNGLFQNCLVGAVDKAPPFLKLALFKGSSPPLFREGSCLFFASGLAEGKSLGQVTDFFSLQLKGDFIIPPAFNRDFEGLWEGVEWLGCPEGLPLESRFPTGLFRHIPPPSVIELGLGGMESLETFLEGPLHRGVVAAYSKPERKFSFIKIEKQ